MLTMHNKVVFSNLRHTISFNRLYYPHKRNMSTEEGTEIIFLGLLALKSAKSVLSFI
jgi:hypothetical protein